MPGLNVVALISGGKDSFFSILHCIEHGHNVVALANLFPATDVEDSDSFMYQTIGHQVIPMYEQALGLPLYRQAIHGHAVSTTKTYIAQHRDAPIDETEALVPLLKRVLEAHPEVTAVSTGAILSDYQRTRVETVATRFGLTPLSYLWQYPRIFSGGPIALLEDMHSVGQESRLIKVSSGGLDSTFLWQDVANASTRERLLKASHRFGSTDDGAALGEGGEYETLTIAGPAPLWKGRLVFDEGDREVVVGEAGNAFLRVANPRVEMGRMPLAAKSLPQPDLLDDHFTTVFEELSTAELKIVPVEQENWEHTRGPIDEHPIIDSTDGTNHTISVTDCIGQGKDAFEQTQDIMESLPSILEEHGHQMEDIALTLLILRDMADFTKVNSAYAKALARPNPPARVTVACASVLKPYQHISLSLVSTQTDTSRPKQGLHVQSISYWAPANIGPYSQAITMPRYPQGQTQTYIAGQIPLIPSTMQLDAYQPVSLRFLHQAVLSLQHLHRVASETNVGAWRHAIAFIVADNEDELEYRSAIARRVWTRTYDNQKNHNDDMDLEQDEDADFDVWHSRYGVNHASFSTGSQASTSASTLLSKPPPELFVIQADSLPRGVPIEWVGHGYTGEGDDSDLMHYSHMLDMFGKKSVLYCELCEGCGKYHKTDEVGHE